MKLLSTIALTTLLAAGTAFAADAPAASTEKPAATATAAPDHHCRDEANAKKLKGAARTSFIKKCRADSKKS